MFAYRKITQIISILLLLILCANLSLAQSSSDTLKEVEIKSAQIKDTLVDKRSEFSNTQAVHKIEKLYTDLYESQSLSNLLSQQSSAFIKSYGVNSMATLSLRGASAAQSAVLWNGVPIMNPAQGVADLSVLQTGLFSDISLKYGSSAALYGSGNVGGALLLDNNYPSFNARKSIAATIGAGSFGAMNTGLNAGWANKKWNINLNGFYQQATNDISYKDENGHTQQLDNAHLQGGSGLFSVDYNLKDGGYKNNARLYLKLWWQTYDREIPPALFEALSVKQQNDRSLRTMVGYEQNTKRSSVYVKGSYDNEFLHYQDSAVAQNYRNTVQQLYGEVGWKYRLDNPDRTLSATWKQPDVHQIMIFTPLQFSSVAGNNILNHETQFRPAVVAAYSYNGFQNRVNANASVRQEWVNGNTAPLLPGAGLSYKILNDLKWKNTSDPSTINLLVRGNIQRTYRIPTLNELYYFPGGNPDLKPEQGWSQDVGYVLAFNHYFGRPQPAISFTHELSAFNRNIEDWIYWLGGAIWTPHNIARVHSRGIETNNKFTFRTGDFKFDLGFNYIYVLSTTEASYLPGDGSIGKQIPYTPRYNAQGNLGAQWRSLFLNINQTYTGYRFVTVDESQYLKPYTTTNVQASFGQQFFRKHYINVVGQLQNIFNTQYEVVNARPMPGRNFLLQLKVTL